MVHSVWELSEVWSFRHDFLATGLKDNVLYKLGERKCIVNIVNRDVDVHRLSPQEK